MLRLGCLLHASTIGCLRDLMMAVQGLMPTLLEDVPDMAVKFTVYESLRSLHQRVFKGRQVCSITSHSTMAPSVPSRGIILPVMDGQACCCETELLGMAMRTRCPCCSQQLLRISSLAGQLAQLLRLPPHPLMSSRRYDPG